jgi:hypothetical protein
MQTCNVAAGAQMGNEYSYFVPRTLLPLPHDNNWYAQKLLPNLAQWRRQSAQRGGDKTICCDKFLNHILPYFVDVLVQDGVFFIKEFPEHPLSHMLKVSTSNYCLVLTTVLTHYTTFYRTKFLAMKGSPYIRANGFWKKKRAVQKTW